MNWESSRAGTDLKRSFLKRFFACESPFFLTGGSALGMFYLDHRQSLDLDLFTLEPLDPLQADATLRETADAISATPRSLQTTPGFRRYELSRAGETEIVDLVAERVAQVDPEKQDYDGIRVDTLREIFVNKICTLVSRSEIKDLIDLYFLDSAGFHVPDGLALARAPQRRGPASPLVAPYRHDSYSSVQ